MTAISPQEPPRLSCYYMLGKDSSGKDCIYRIRIFEDNTNGTNDRKQIALTKDQWEQEKTLLQQTLGPFFAGTDQKPPSFEVSINPDRVELSSKCDKAFRHTIRHRISNDFHSIISGKERKFVWELIPLPKFNDTWEIPFNFDPKLPPPRIQNEGNDCFILSYLYGFVFNNQDFIPRLQEQARVEKNERKAAALKCILCFLYRCYQELEKAPESREIISGVHELREAFAILNENQNLCNTSQNDIMESSMFIQNLFHENLPITCQQDCPQGFIPTPYQQKKSLRELIEASICDTYKWDSLPKHLNFYLQEKKSIQTPGTPDNTLELTLKQESYGNANEGNQTYELTTIVKHIGKPGQSGHYITYVKRGEEYFEYNDAKITEFGKDNAKFLEAAQNPYVLGYTRKP